MTNTLIKQWSIPRDDEYMFLIDKQFGGPILKNEIKLEFNDRIHEWKLVTRS